MTTHVLLYTIIHVEFSTLLRKNILESRRWKMENRKVYLDDHTNLLQLEEHMYPLVDVKTPNVFRNLFHYDEIPKIAFNDRIVPHCMPDEIWITDTTFRDGQQSRAPYSTEQIVTLYDYFIVWVVRRERSDSVNSSSIVKRTETQSTNAWKRIINSRR